MTAFLDMCSPGRLPAVNPVFNANCLSSTEVPASLLKFVEKRPPVDKSILVRGVRLEIGWRGEGDWGFCMEESRHSSLNSHLLYQQNHLG